MTTSADPQSALSLDSCSEHLLSLLEQTHQLLSTLNPYTSSESTIDIAVIQSHQIIQSINTLKIQLTNYVRETQMNEFIPTRDYTDELILFSQCEMSELILAQLKDMSSRLTITSTIDASTTDAGSTGSVIGITHIEQL